MFEKITKTLSGLAFIKYINSLIDYVNTSDIDATRIKGQLDISNIPPAGLDNVIKVDTVTDMLALTVDDVQNGDTVMIIGVTPPVQYQVVDDTKLGTMDAFQEYAAGTATKALADINGNNIHTTYGKLAGNNTWTGNNYWNGSAIFNANLNIRGSATTPSDSSTYLWLGLKPEGSEQTPSIARNKQGDLVMYAADYRHCYLRSGIQTSFASVYKSDGTVEFSSLNNTPWGKYTSANGLELTVHKTPTVNNDVPNKKYVDDSVASATADLLSSNNTWTGSNTYNSNIVVKANGTAEVVEGSVYLGRSSKTNQARITGDATGNLYLTNSEDGYTYINNGSNSVAYFGNATIKFYKPTYITNGSSAGSSATLYLGVKPTNETVQARIGTDNLGGLFYHASTNQPHIFRIGTNNNVFVIRDDDTKVAFSSNDNHFATVTHDGVAKWLGNANTATKLQTARKINGVAFDGTKDITIEAGGGGDVTAAGDNYFTGKNTFNRPITVRDGELAGIGGTITLGTKPNSATTQAKINSTTTGAMYYTATEGLAHSFNVGATKVATIGGTATTATLDFLANSILKYSTSSGLRVGGGGTSKIIGFYPEAADNTAGMRLSNQAEAISTDYSIFSLQNNSAISYTKNAALQVGNFKILEVDKKNNNVTIKADSNGQILFTPNNLASNTSSIDSNGNFYISQGLTVGSTLNTGTSNGVIRAGNNESCLYFTGTAENTYYATPNTGNTISYQSAANCYLINCSINNPSSLNMNFSNMNFKATVGSVPYMCKTLTFWLPVGATVPAVTWKFPTGSAVYYPKGVAPTLTANANNIINVIAVVDDTGSFSIQVCDTVVLPYSG